MKTFFAILVFIAVMFVFSNAKSQQVCAERTSITKQLSKKYSEKPVALGIAHNGGVVEVWSSLSGNSWTILITMPDGLTCMVTSGESWETLPISEDKDAV